MALTEDEIKLLFDKGLLGVSSAEAILNTLWLNNSLHFRLRGVKEHHDMRWGDVKLCKTDQGAEYLEFNDRCETLRTKNVLTAGSEKDPVAVYKLFVQKRPEKMKEPDAPFYIAVNNVSMKSKSSNSEKCWFKCNAVGTNKLGGLMKEMSKKAGLQNDKLRNHSARKTMIQTLSENNVPQTQIAQLSGHKNLKSIENYSHLSTKQQMHMSNHRQPKLTF